MAGIFIGIGGVGGSIVGDVHDSLRLHELFAGDHPAAHQAAEQFRFFLVDSWKDGGVAASFAANEIFDVPEGSDKFGVDKQIVDWFYGADPSFASWWPADSHGAPLTVGDFAAGAGQLRVKGKLAYRIRLTGKGSAIANTIQKAYFSIQNALGAAEGTQIVPVYIVCSLGGGSGSGMALVLAEHLRTLLPGNCPIIGVFPLAGVTETKVGGGDSDSIWANTDAALREIDFSMHPSPATRSTVQPFFQWPGHGNQITGDSPPFQYVYLFSRQNANDLALNTFNDYARLIAECLVAESFSGLMEDNGLNTAIAGPHSQFLQRLYQTPIIVERPARYASAAVGSVRYPAERVEQHLAWHYGARVLNLVQEIDDKLAATDSDTFLNEHALLWYGAPPLDGLFDVPLSANDVYQDPLPTFPRFDDNTFAAADRSQTLTIVNQQKERYEKWIGNDLAPYLTAKRHEIVNGLRGPDGVLAIWVNDLLQRSSLGTARAAVQLVHERLDQDYNRLFVEVNGNDAAALDNDSLKGSYAALEEQWHGGFRKLENGFGSGLSKAFNGKGKNAKAAFLNQTWRTRRSVSEGYRRASAGLQTTGDVRGIVHDMLSALNGLNDQVTKARDALQSGTVSTLGAVGFGGVLDVPVLDDSRIVDRHFAPELDRAIGAHAHDSAAATVTSPGGIRDALASRVKSGGKASSFSDQTFREGLMAMVARDGVAHLGPIVRSLTIWDALNIECTTRLALDYLDNALSAALQTTRAAQIQAQRAGARPREWEPDLLQNYIFEKLQECQKRVAPYWKLDNQMVATHEKPYGFTIVAADMRAYDDARNNLNLPDFLSNLSHMLGASEPFNLPGKDAIVLYSREGGVPLCYLDKTEIKHLTDAAGQMATTKFLYTDSRFADAVAPAISPGEQAESTLKYAIAAALELGVLTDNPVGTGQSIHFGENGTAAEFSSVHAIYNRARSDPAFRATLYESLNDRWASVPPNFHKSLLTQALAKAHSQLHTATKAVQKNGVVDANAAIHADWWRDAAMTIQQRLDHGLYAIQF